MGGGDGPETSLCLNTSRVTEGLTTFSPHADSLVVKAPVAFLKANRVWGALRGKFCVVRLSFSSKDLFPFGALENQAQQEFASSAPLQGVSGIPKMTSTERGEILRPRRGRGGAFVHERRSLAPWLCVHRVFPAAASDLVRGAAWLAASRARSPPKKRT